MNRKLILSCLSAVLFTSNLQAEDKPAGLKPDGDAQSASATAPGKQNDPTAPSDGPTARQIQQRQQRMKRAGVVAMNGANQEFGNSPQGLAFKNQLDSLDQELNAVYEKYLNICRESPTTEKGKMLRAERDRELQLLAQKRATAEADYEKLKETSPEYRAMVEKHQKSRLAKYIKNPLKPGPESKEETENGK